MRVMITGAAGLIGDAVFRYISAETAFETIRVDRAVIRDLADASACKLLKQFGCVDAIVHCAAAIPSALNNTTIETTNMQIDSNVFEYASSHNATIIFLSSLSLYTDYGSGVLISEDSEVKSFEYLSPYMKAKLHSEHRLLQRSSGRSVVFRVSSPFGINQRNQNVLSVFIRQALAGNSLQVFGSGKRTQDFIYADDIARAATRALTSQTEGVYNICGGTSISMIALAQLITKLAGGDDKRTIVGKKPDPQDTFRVEVDIAKAERELNWRPTTTLQEGVANVIKGWSSQ